MKFILFVEGDTEKRALPSFLKRWLGPKLSQPVGISPICFNGNDNYLAEVRKRAELYLRHQDVIAVIGLLDLYGLSLPSHLSEVYEKYDWAKQDIEKRVSRSKFRQFFAVHELEAWLLSDPAIFPSQVMTALRSAAANPEAVNFDQPPAKLLSRVYREKLKTGHKIEYKKTADGTTLFSKLDPEVAYQKCPRLRELLDEMLRLAKDHSQ
ncbi:MAG: DUF4276 family protein [Acidobacteriota bacterium]